MMDTEVAKRRIAETVGKPRLITATMIKKWDTYGIHALEAVYPLFRPGGWLSAANTGTAEDSTNIVHARHSDGVDAVLAVVPDLYGAIGLINVYGTECNSPFVRAPFYPYPECPLIADNDIHKIREDSSRRECCWYEINCFA